MQTKGLVISFIWYLTMEIINLDSLCIFYIYPPVTVVITDNAFLLSSFLFIYLFILIYLIFNISICRVGHCTLYVSFIACICAHMNCKFKHSEGEPFFYFLLRFSILQVFFSFRFLLLDAEKIKRTNKVFLPAVQSMFSLHVLCISWIEHSLTMSNYCTKRFIHSDYSDLRTYIDNTWTSEPVVWSSHNKLGCHGNREMFRWMRMMISYSISTSR